MKCAWHAKVTATTSEKILPLRDDQTQLSRPLYGVASTRTLEGALVQPPHSASLMQHAGLAIAQLTLALAPHAKSIWIACGPGNNGGDGLEAAAQLAGLGKAVTVSELSGALPRQGNALQAWRAAQTSKVKFSDAPPKDFDFCIDALFGIGKSDGFGASYETWITHINDSESRVLAVDIPSGLHADTGVAASSCVQADFTLSLLTLKPGLFTSDGRAMVGEVWFNPLVAQELAPSTANLATTTVARLRPHNTHKGSFGDVAIVGGDVGMVGAAVLAGRAALHGGAGRVFLGLLTQLGLTHDELQPELMIRSFESLAIQDMSVVAGCGGGDGIAQHLQSVVQHAKTLVLDADALNHLARSVEAQTLLSQRPENTSVLTPHPLEAARLLKTSVAEVQANRLNAAQTLADQWNCVVALKGSGTIIARPRRTPTINATGNAGLATAGTGDVLAGLIGSYLAQGMSAWDAASSAVFHHGRVADLWPSEAGTLTAGRLAQAL